MSIWFILLVVCITGAIGGVINAYFAYDGFVLPQTDKDDKYKIFRPGFLGNVIVGAVAAGVYWGFSSAVVDYVILSTAQTTGDKKPIELTIGALVSAAMAGIAGAKWLSNEVDKKLLRATASEAAAGQPKSELSRKVMTLPPGEALKAAQKNE